MSLYDYVFNNKRKRKIVDFITQVKISIEVLVLSLMFAAFLLFACYVEPMATWFSDKGADVHQFAIEQVFLLNAGKWPILLLAVVGVTLVSVLFSHRLAGPVYKVIVTLRKLSTGDLRNRLWLREHDYFHNLVPDFNAFVDRVAVDIAACRQALARLEAAGELNSDQQELLTKAMDRLNSYQINETDGNN